MPAPTISTPPPAPNRNLPTLFSARADDFFTWMVTASGEFNAQAAYMNNLALATGPGQFLDGSVAAPGITFASDLDNGFYRSGTNSMGVVNGGTEIARFTTTGTRFGNVAANPTGVSAPVVQIEAASATAALSVKRASADAGAPFLHFLKSHGAAINDFTLVNALDALGELRGLGADGTTHVIGAYMRMVTEGTPAAGDVRAGFRFFSGSGAAGAVTEALRIDINQAVLANGLGGLGYGTGAGGAVTQVTSRTTGVTLDKPCGAITLFSAAGSVTPASFVVTNAKVSALDTVNISQKSGTNDYVACVSRVAAGSFTVTFYTTGGTATDAPVFNFAVVKAVIS